MTLFFDGAFGTYYNSLYNNNKNCEFACIDYPERVIQIHREYIKAGVNAIKTDSFGANRLLTENRETINSIIRKSYSLAREAAEGTDVRVFADIGYINHEDTEEEYLHIAKEFINCGASYFLFETLGEYAPIREAVRYIKENLKKSIVIVSFACDQNGYTGKGFYYKNLIKEALEEADYSGLNCVCGPYHTYRLLKDIENVEKKAHRLSAMPNTSYPTLKGGRYYVYEDNKDYYSDRLLEIYSLGMGAVGGCCGSRPEHIKLFIEKAKRKSFGYAKPENFVKTDILKKSEKEKNLLNLLSEGRKIIACELDSPLDGDFSFMRESGEKLKNAGCDIITVADSPLARAHADSFMSGAKIKREVGIDVLPHLACRDRNHIGIKGTLLGAYIEKINNVLAITGDPVGGGGRGVYSYNSFTLIEYINHLNETVFSENPFCICGALNINSPNFDTELRRAEKKIGSGCRVFFTQPVYSDEAQKRLKRAKGTLDAYIFGGIMPIVSHRNALFLNNEVFGIDIPTETVRAFEGLDKEKALETGLRVALRTAERIKDACHGYYLMIPLRKTDLIISLIEKIKGM
ncbi:MAG: bifunctional homocysteine S-methyltransferase/methylenetetrahydrofolate reductase [Armatimonadetes bacterium]|nr:bifunctional homocysteine S-methyltransferase/methylenetetrahydrofolate reductase [Candidatus Hippobium faecium]